MLGRALRKPLLAAAVTGALASLAALAAGQGQVALAAGQGKDIAAARSTGRGGPRVAATGDQLRVNPFPGTPDASPQSEIIFSALAQSDLASVTVVGSRSGRHTGHLITLPDHAGAAFVPDRPFTPGEHVRVMAALTSPQAGTASGPPGATHLTFSFSVLVPVAMPS